MPKYKCFSCMKTFESASSYPTAASGGKCPWCMTLVTDSVNRLQDAGGRPRSNSFPVGRSPTGNWQPTKMPFLSERRQTSASSSSSVPSQPLISVHDQAFKEVVTAWCRKQSTYFKSSKFTNYLIQEFFKFAATLPPERLPLLMSACAIHKVELRHHNAVVLLLRFYDGKPTGLLPPSQFSYDKDTASTNEAQTGSAQAHQEGRKAGSNYLSMTGNISCLVATSCQSVKGIVFGLSDTQQEMIKRKTAKFKNRQSPCIGVFLVPSPKWKIDHNIKSERAHLSEQENEVLFDAAQGALGEFLLFTVPNPYYGGAYGKLNTKFI